MSDWLKCLRSRSGSNYEAYCAIHVKLGEGGFRTAINLAIQLWKWPSTMVTASSPLNHPSDGYQPAVYSSDPVSGIDVLDREPLTTLELDAAVEVAVAVAVEPGPEKVAWGRGPLTTGKDQRWAQKRQNEQQQQQEFHHRFWLKCRLYYRDCSDDQYGIRRNPQLCP